MKRDYYTKVSQVEVLNGTRARVVEADPDRVAITISTTATGNALLEPIDTASLTKGILLTSFQAYYKTSDQEHPGLAAEAWDGYAISANVYFTIVETIYNPC